MKARWSTRRLGVTLQAPYTVYPTILVRRTVNPMERIEDDIRKARAKIRPALPDRALSARLDDGQIVEAIRDPQTGKTAFCVGNETEQRTEEIVVVKGRRVLPYSRDNNLLRNGVVLLPSGPSEYDSEASLVADIRSYLRRYVEVSPRFETIASYYVLFSWVYDAFNELPYLRLRGEPGTGKTRFLLTVGALCYKPIFASGASTVSPIFRMLDAFGGTLVVDEGDFRMSDEKAEIVKILNNGNGRGFPVLRSDVSKRGEVNPAAFSVYGPKLVATRGYFEDRALESRCVTEEMGQRPLSRHLPVSLVPKYQDEALAIRNKLLMFRFRTLHRAVPDEAHVDLGIEPRLNQIFVPLLSVVEDPRVREEMHALAREFQRDLIADRSFDTEALVAEVIRDLRKSGVDPLTIGEVTRTFSDRHQEDFERKITPKWVGSIVRRKLRLRTYKAHGTFVIAEEELSRLDQVLERYGLVSSDQAKLSETPGIPESGGV